MSGPLGFPREWLRRLNMECGWGDVISHANDPEPCSLMAVQILVIHGLPEGGDVTTQLCPRHWKMVEHLTTPTAET